jgi:protein-tyrosine phosphatase
MSALSCGALVVLAGALCGCGDGDHERFIDGRVAAHPTAVSPAGSSGAAGSAAPPSTSGGSGGASEMAGAAPCGGKRWVLTADLRNARDLGGTPLEQGGAVACGSLFRGPPLRLTSTGCAEAQQLGIRTVIDLRTDSERAGNPDATCVGADFVHAPLPIPYGLSAADYLVDLRSSESMARAFHAFGDSTRYPIYFHCTWGRDRTGVVGAVLLLTLGATPAEVMSEYLLSQPVVGAYPDALEAVLEAVDAQGGPDAFLASLGITPDEIAVIRSHAMAD